MLAPPLGLNEAGVLIEKVYSNGWLLGGGGGGVDLCCLEDTFLDIDFVDGVGDVLCMAADTTGDIGYCCIGLEASIIIWFTEDEVGWRIEDMGVVGEFDRYAGSNNGC